MADWEINQGAIVERPRDVGAHPLLAEIYGRHDALIRRRAIRRGERTLEVAFGRHPHPDADVGIEAFPGNAREVAGRDVDAHVGIADARDLPFRDGAFDVVVGRRVLHHVPAEDRDRIVDEARRVLAPDGTLYFGAVQTMPFARPAFGDILKALDFVIANDYPARGEVTEISSA